MRSGSPISYIIFNILKKLYRAFHLHKVNLDNRLVVRPAKCLNNESLANLSGAINKERIFSVVTVELLQSLFYLAKNHAI